MILTVHTKPNARVSKIDKWIDETTVVVSVAAPAKEGRANRALIEFFAEHFGVAKSHVVLVRGTTTRIKHVEIIGR